LISLPISSYLIINYSFNGAVAGLAIINTGLLLPAIIEVYKLGLLNKIKLTINQNDTIRLSKFSLMQIFSLATLPLAEIHIRNLITQNAGWHETGLWQSLMRLSSIYISFFTTFLAAYYMPTLSTMFDKKQIFRYVIKYILGIGGVFLMIAMIVYAFREFVFLTIFSKEFRIPAEYVKYQLIGDLFKIMSYVIGFLIVAKANTKVYILGEVVQTALYLGIATWFIKNGDVTRIFSAYAVSNFLYFCICFFGLFLFKNNFTSSRT